MSNGDTSTPPDDGWASNAGPHEAPMPFTTERVQSILESQNKHPSSYLTLFYNDPTKTYGAVITKNLNSFQTQVLRKRALTDTEVTALTDHWGTSANVALTAKPAALLLTAFLAYRGRARFRFPFWQPKWINTSPDIFPTIAQPLVTGRGARVAWHTLRVVTYGALCNWLVTPFFLSYAGVRATVSISSDPRLQEAIKESVKDIQAQKKINHLQKRSGQTPTEFPHQEEGGQAGSGSAGAPGAKGWSRQDDASPQSGAYDDASPQASTYQSSGSQRWDTPKGGAQETPASRAYGTSRPQNQTQPPPEPERSAAWGDDSILADLDDGSPVAPTARAQETQQRPQRPARRQPPPASEDGVSSWERLRQQVQSEKSDDSKN